MQYKNPGKIAFSNVIKDAGGGGMFVEFPYNVEELFGVKGRVPIKAEIEGISYRGSLAKMDQKCHLLIILKSIRTQIGKQAGDTVNVTLELDTTERKVELPADFAAKLNHNKAAKQNFANMAFSHQREYITWITSAKKAETRTTRIEKAIEMLSHNQKVRP